MSTIGGPEELVKWKAEQKAKQEAWDAGHAARYAKAKERAIGVLEGKTPTHDYQAEIERQYNERQAALVKQVCRPETCKPIENKSFLQRTIDKVLNFFLDLKF